MIAQIFKVVKALHADDEPNQLAAGTAVALIVGLTPFWSFHNLVLLLLVCILRVHVGFFVISFALFSLAAMFVQTPLHQLGEYLLLLPSLESFWTALYQIDVIRLFHFNHTLTLGGFVASMVLVAPVFWLTCWGVVNYREKVIEWLEGLPFVQTLQASTWFVRLVSLSKGA